MQSTLQSYGADFKERLFRGQSSAVEDAIHNYFNETENSSDFKLRKTGRCFHVFNPERGYVFVSSFDSENYESRLKEAVEEYRKNSGIKIDREVIDHDAKLAGFSWRKE